jgi:hypothetical protein
MYVIEFNVWNTMYEIQCMKYNVCKVLNVMHAM